MPDEHEAARAAARNLINGLESWLSRDDIKTFRGLYETVGDNMQVPDRKPDVDAAPGDA